MSVGAGIHTQVSVGLSPPQRSSEMLGTLSNVGSVGHRPWEWPQKASRGVSPGLGVQAASEASVVGCGEPMPTRNV